MITDVRSRSIHVNDELLREQAKIPGEKLGVTDFAYSSGSVTRFKHGHGIKTQNSW